MWGAQSLGVRTGIFRTVAETRLNSVQEPENNKCESGSEETDLPEAKTGRQADGSGKPKTCAGCQSAHLALGKHDQTSSEKSNARRNGLDETKRVDPGRFTLKGVVMGYLDGQDRNDRARQAN